MWFGRGMIIGALMLYFGILMASLQIPFVYKAFITDPRDFVLLKRYMRTAENSPYFMEHFEPVTHDHKGVSKRDDALMWGDYTFAAVSKGSRAFLVDNNGDLVHEWVAPISETWPDISHVGRPMPLHLVYFDRAFLAPEMNGDIYVTYIANGDPIDSHYALVKLDKDSNVIWRYADRTHHDVVFLNDEIITFVSETTYVPNPNMPQVVGAHFNEYLVFIDPETGKEKRRLDMLAAFWDTDFEYFRESFISDLKHTLMMPGDIIHPNTITPIPDYAIGKAPMLKENSVMISSRNHDLLFIIDLETEKVTWASYGPFKGQHSPRFLENGHVVLFDNMGYKGRSRVLELDLNTMGEVWYFADEQENNGFFSQFNSMVDLLPNGNILTTSTHEGRIFEVTRDKKIVWEYFYPERIQDGSIERIPLVYSGKRYSKDQLTFLSEGQ